MPMPSATLTSKGQITIPAAVRAGLNLRAGDRMEFVKNERGNYEVIAQNGSIKDLRGMLPKPRKPVSIAAMNRAIARMGSDRE